MPSLDRFFHNSQAEKLMENSGDLEQLMGQPETQQIFSILRKSTGGNLEQAADNAAKGDSAQLMSAIKHLMSDPEGAKLIRQMKEKLK